MLDNEQLQYELDNEYQPVFVELKLLEHEYPSVARNQNGLVEDSDLDILVNTYAALLYASQDDTVEPKSPKEIREALKILESVTGFKSSITDLVGRLVPATVFIVERLYFQNRFCERCLKEKKEHKGRNITDWVYPSDRLNKLRDLTRSIWRHNVLASAEG